MSILLQVTDHLCDIVCGMCGLMSENHEAWDQHVAEVTLKEDADHASLLSAKMSSSEEKVDFTTGKHKTNKSLIFSSFRSRWNIFKSLRSAGGRVRSVGGSLRPRRRGTITWSA